ncbi:uncharacterized protein VTP21DRAFT_2728 [Calcarisporiella thermophila]|uniref:uncharacterized protein n=1 Tax=Calcarisporiella thermophila TaxID=911321 RepID=UPI0037424927
MKFSINRVFILAALLAVGVAAQEKNDMLVSITIRPANGEKFSPEQMDKAKESVQKALSENGEKKVAVQGDTFTVQSSLDNLPSALASWAQDYVVHRAEAKAVPEKDLKLQKAETMEKKKKEDDKQLASQATPGVSDATATATAPVTATAAATDSVGSMSMSMSESNMMTSMVSTSSMMIPSSMMPSISMTMSGSRVMSPTARPSVAGGVRSFAPHGIAAMALGVVAGFFVSI